VLHAAANGQRVVRKRRSRHAGGIGRKQAAKNAGFYWQTSPFTAANVTYTVLPLPDGTGEGGFDKLL